MLFERPNLGENQEEKQVSLVSRVSFVHSGESSANHVLFSSARGKNSENYRLELVISCSLTENRQQLHVTSVTCAEEVKIKFDNVIWKVGPPKTIARDVLASIQAKVQPVEKKDYAHHLSLTFTVPSGITPGTDLECTEADGTLIKDYILAKLHVPARIVFSNGFTMDFIFSRYFRVVRKGKKTVAAKKMSNLKRAYGERVPGWAKSLIDTGKSGVVSGVKASKVLLL